MKKESLENKVYLKHFSSIVKATLSPWEIGLIYYQQKGYSLAEIGHKIKRFPENIRLNIQSARLRLLNNFKGEYSEDEIKSYLSACIFSGKLSAPSYPEMRKIGLERVEAVKRKCWTSKKRNKSKIEESNLAAILGELRKSEKAILLMSYFGKKPLDMAQEMGCKNDLRRSAYFIRVAKSSTLSRLKSRIKSRQLNINIVDLVEQGLERHYLKIPTKRELRDYDLKMEISAFLD